MNLTVEIPHVLYNRLLDLMDTYGYGSESEAIVACITSTYIDYLFKGDYDLKTVSFYLPVEFIGEARKKDEGLANQLDNNRYKVTGDYVRETIEQALIQRENIKFLLGVCPPGFHEAQQKRTFSVSVEPSVYLKFKQLCHELKIGASKAMTGLLYYRLKVKGLIDEN